MKKEKRGRHGPADLVRASVSDPDKDYGGHVSREYVTFRLLEKAARCLQVLVDSSVTK